MSMNKNYLKTQNNESVYIVSYCQSFKSTNYVKACERKGIGVDERSYNYFKTQYYENILILAVF